MWVRALWGVAVGVFMMFDIAELQSLDDQLSMMAPCGTIESYLGYYKLRIAALLSATVAWKLKNLQWVCF